jgi:hypothetical protein
VTRVLADTKATATATATAPTDQSAHSDHGNVPGTGDQRDQSSDHGNRSDGHRSSHGR